ncbi:MAG: putative ABC transporter ATP-binding protein YbhF [Bacteroidetes bacterium ADurb.Bin416]|jgi:ABC-type multidrug transport system ATPase subunit|nr:MAG: putative ABC transporter ATP-binding protein YbhF [Bacteroidetes bacterium ADurb.Bin416]
MKPLSVQTLQKNYRNGTPEPFVGLGRPEGQETAGNISFEVDKGEVFGLIGPDGAGKTTLFRMLATLLLPDKGTATVEGMDIRSDYKAIRHRIGYMPGRFSLYQDLTVAENLGFFATLFDTTVAANKALIDPIYRHIEPFKNRLAGHLSGGMKQKLALSCALVHKPSLLLLDEPTTGVDAVSRGEFWDMLGNLKAEGITILVSTPYMDEALRCDRVALIQDGRFLDIDSPAGIIAHFEPRLLAIEGVKITRLLKDLRQLEGVKQCHAFGDSLHVTVTDPQLQPQRLSDLLASMGHTGITVTPITPGIEDCFLALGTPSSSSKPPRP